jgi:hypothetical protein
MRGAVFRPNLKKRHCLALCAGQVVALHDSAAQGVLAERSWGNDFDYLFHGSARRGVLGYAARAHQRKFVLALDDEFAFEDEMPLRQPQRRPRRPRENNAKGLVRTLKSSKQF